MRRLKDDRVRKWSGLPIRRIFWLLMIGSHLPTIAGVWLAVGGDAAIDPVRLFGLVAALSFFALKLFDVHWLRFRHSPRTWVVLALVLALVHAESLGLDPDHTMAPQSIAVLTGAAMLEPVQRRWIRFYDQYVRAPRRPAPSRGLLPAPIRSALELAAARPWWTLVRTLAPPRAPPC
ncbi:MAG: hypothetical protein L6Q92_12585 [Phycisphaerae bacterium]|nr:hypothetical protein [Phycisphaerae bacterium]